ncbi:class I SAM-dependent methyltransferase [Rhodovulum sp. FJ3]|uniref:class I SAM-dependent methyltransferase n=1 Tax=Rhodovulum sp. FJ3 TaxID=3079053 RepID=UPI00293DE974|nr:class I SAM-dependent methyltransferase [Rhodovulum sp. FJ3]MDV4169426.1 class I SAM-dependent methyltransferase [Rhodovulum sp. FJ3]
MSDSRLTLAASAGLIPVTSGLRIAVYRARSTTDLSAFSDGEITVFQGFKPDFDALSARGFTCLPEPEGAFDAALICVPRSKAEARHLIHDALGRVNGGPVIVDGHKTDGIDSLLKDCRKHLSADPAFSKAHGKVFVVRGEADAVADWHQTPREIADGFTTVAGVFSAEKIDKGSAALLDALPRGLKGAVADFGAGWGYLSRHVLAENDKIERLFLLEAEHAALSCARVNVTDPRADFIWFDVARDTAPMRFDTIIMNPPFHVSRAGDPDIGIAFLQAAARALTPTGQLFLVANRHLPYEKDLTNLFRDVEEIGGTSGFKVLHAGRVLKGTKPPARGR